MVAVTGAAGGLGRSLTESLVAADGVRRVVALDSERGDVDGATWRIVDVTAPVVATRLSGVDVVVHLALDTSLATPPAQRSRANVRSTQAVLTAAAAAGVRRVVMCTSAAVYGARPDNPVPLDEDAPLQATAAGSVVGDMVEVERLAAAARRTHPGLSVTVVRPAAVVGPGVDTVITRHFEAPRLLYVRGSCPTWQFCHVDDLVSALVRVVLSEIDGPVTVGCEGWLEQGDVERISGRGRVELPGRFALGTAERLHRARLIPAASADLEYVMYPWVVPSTRLRAAGWQPAYDNTDAFVALLEQVSGHHAVGARRLGRRDATIGAAGATVAAIGTAALVRRARRRRRA